MAVASFTLSEIARRLDVPQHRLIHLCEKGVVVPEIHDAAGRGSSRVFSPDNFLELAVALRLRDMMLPVSLVGAIVHVLRGFGDELLRSGSSTLMADSLRQSNSPELRVIVSDGKAIYFSLAASGKEPKLFGGISVDQAAAGPSAWSEAVQPVPAGANRTRRTDQRLGPERSEFARMELSVTAVARVLPLD